MANHAGKEGTVKIGASTIAEIREYSIEETGDTADNTTLDNTTGWKTHLATFSGWSGSVSCYWDETDTNGQQTLTIGASVTLNVYPEGAGTADEFYSGTATVTGISRKAAFDGMVEAEFSFLGSGALTADQVPA